MTKQEIKDAVCAAIDNELPSIPDNQTLGSTDNTTITDAAADVLATVNPNHTYPPVNK